MSQPPPSQWTKNDVRDFIAGLDPQQDAFGVCGAVFYSEAYDGAALHGLVGLSGAQFELVAEVTQVPCCLPSQPDLYPHLYADL